MVVCFFVVLLIAYLILLEYTPIGLGTLFVLSIIVVHGTSLVYYTNEGNARLGLEQMKARNAFNNQIAVLSYVPFLAGVGALFWFPPLCAYNDIAAGIVLSLQAELVQSVIGAYAHKLETSSNKQFQILSKTYRGEALMNVK